MRSLRSLVLAGMAAALGCAGRPADPAPDVNLLHGAFISALKKRLWSDEDGFETGVLSRKTSAYRRELEWDALHEALPAARRDTYDSYRAANREAVPIAPSGDIAMTVHVLTEKERSELDAMEGPEEYWNAFHGRFRNAVALTLSAPGFSEDGSQALLYYSAAFDPLAAWGCYCLLERKEGQWEIVAEHMVWVS